MLSNSSANLTDVLQVFLEGQGRISVSEPGDPLTNILTLCIKNIGINPLYNNAYGPPPDGYNPVIQVRFVYGSDDSSGVLAPDNNKDAPSLGSAWAIEVSVSHSKKDNWKLDGPNIEEDHPTWQISPSDQNTQVLKTGKHANTYFQFYNIVSFTPPGNTQMTVSFSGFMQDANTAYEDTVFTLNILKVNPPSIRGILDFDSLRPIIYIYNFDEIEIGFKWTVFLVDKTILTPLLPIFPPEILNYQTKGLSRDGTYKKLSYMLKDTQLAFSLEAFDANGNLLNAMQCAVSFRSRLFTDSAGLIYPTVKVNSLLWMAANLDYDTPEGNSSYYNDNTDLQVPYGRYYSWQDASKNIPEGWRLPTSADWNELILASGGYGTNGAYYSLINDAFGATLGGDYNPNSNHPSADIHSSGYYWTSTLEEESNTYNIIWFDASSKKVKRTTARANFKYNVRYVKDLPIIDLFTKD